MLVTVMPPGLSLAIASYGLRKSIPLIFGIYTTFVSLLLWGPFFPVSGVNVASGDSAVFAYVGQRILAGGLPYREAWDNKPPLVYYINALELWMFPNSFLGLWLVSFLAAAAAIGLCYLLCRILFAPLLAAFGVSCMLSALLVVVEYPNLTEVYGLPLQFGIFLLFLTILRNPHRRRYLFALGFSASTLLLLRQNVATPIVFVAGATLYLWFASSQSRRLRIQQFIGLTAGGMVGLAIPLGYFAYRGALGLLYQSTVGYVVEFGLVSAPLAAQIRSLFPCFRALHAGIFAVAGIWFAGLSRLKHEASVVRWLVLLSTIDLILEMLLSSVPATGYLHYGICWVPALSLLSAYFGSVLIIWSGAREFAPGNNCIMGECIMGEASAMLVGLIVAVNLTLLAGLIDRGVKPRGDERATAVAEYVRGVTRPTDRVFVWGGHAEINVLANRASGSRFFYHAGLLQRGFANTAVVDEIAGNLLSNRPTLIIDPPSRQFPPLDASRRELFVKAHPEHQRLCALLQPMFAVVSENYTRKDTPDLAGWVVYEPKHAAR